MSNKIQLRRDTSTNWTTVNPILSDGEPGLETDTNKIKYGDGGNVWTCLPYASGGGGGNTGVFTFGTTTDGVAYQAMSVPYGDNIYVTADMVNVNSRTNSGLLAENNVWVFTGDPNFDNNTGQPIPSCGAYIWQFGANGILQIPGPIVGNCANTAIIACTAQWTFDAFGNLILPPCGTINFYCGRDALVSTWASLGNKNNACGPQKIALGVQAQACSPASCQSIAIGANAGHTSQASYSVAIGACAGNENQGSCAIAIGYSALYCQGGSAIAIGSYAGYQNQGCQSIAIGESAAGYNQHSQSIAVGFATAYNCQGNGAVAIGCFTAYYGQGTSAIAIGKDAAFYQQAPYSVAIGTCAANHCQGQWSVAVGHSAAYGATICQQFTDSCGSKIYLENNGGIQAGMYVIGPGFCGQQRVVSVGSCNCVTLSAPACRPITTGNVLVFKGVQGNYSTAVGAWAACTGQGGGATAIGLYAGSFYQGNNAIAIGTETAAQYQGTCSIAIGAGAGGCTQGSKSIAIGLYAGFCHQGTCSIAIGTCAGKLDKGACSVAIGTNAGSCHQADYAVAIGTCAGLQDQSTGGVAIGYQTGVINQGGLAVGYYTAQNWQGFCAIAIGSYAAQGANEITIINAACGSNITVGSTYGITVGMKLVANGFSNGTTVTQLLGCNRLALSCAPYTCVVPGETAVFYSGQGQYSIAIGYQTGASNQGGCAVAIGSCAGLYCQGSLSVAIGPYAGYSGQCTISVAIGDSAAYYCQGHYAVAVGPAAGYQNQGNLSVAIGYGAGFQSQGTAAVAIGCHTGCINQGNNAVAIGSNAGNNNQGNNAVAIGRCAGYSCQHSCAVSIGYKAGYTQQQTGAIAVGSHAGCPCTHCGFIQRCYAIAIGYQSGAPGQNTAAVAIGKCSGSENQGQNSIAVGACAAHYEQGNCAVAVGRSAGYTRQSSYSIAVGAQSTITNAQYATVIGYNAHATGCNQIAIGRCAGSECGSFPGTCAIAIGNHAGHCQQHVGAIAIGPSAGYVHQLAYAIGIGAGAGAIGQSGNAVAIGNGAGTQSQGCNAIAIGKCAGHNCQHANSIIINASSAVLDAAAAGFFVAPIRNIPCRNSNVLIYCYSSNEISYTPVGFVGSTDWAAINNKIGPCGPTSIALGQYAGYAFQFACTVAIGTCSGYTCQTTYATAVGAYTGSICQGYAAVALGAGAGYQSQGIQSVAIGLCAGTCHQGYCAVAVGYNAGGCNQGYNAVAIGAKAGTCHQPSNSIMINAACCALNGINSGFYVRPVRNDTSNVNVAVYYNTATNEITYATNTYLPGWLYQKASAAQSIGNGADTPVIFDTVINNFGNVGIYTADNAGFQNVSGEAKLYQFTSTVTFDVNPTGTRFVYLAINGNISEQSRFAEVGGGANPGGDITSLNVTGTILLNPTDYVQIYAYQTSGGDLNISVGGGYGGSTLTITKLS